MPAFLPPPEPVRPHPQHPGRSLRGWLLASAALGALATLQPWVQVRFQRLFGELSGPPGWQSSAGFTCLCTCLLVAVMAMAETRAHATQQAVRPGSVMLVAVSAVALAIEWGAGPGLVRGVSASWTVAFWLVAASVPVLLAVCLARWTAVARAR